MYSMNLSSDRPSAAFVAINNIACQASYVERFRTLFQTRAHAIDTAPGFLGMYVLEPKNEGEDFLVVSQWTSEQAFDAWTKSEAFIEGHKRAFSDLQAAKKEGTTPPMHSEMRKYSVVAN